MVSIRTTSIDYTDAYFEAFRGDTVIIPIQKVIPEGSTTKSQLRSTPDDSSYFDLIISNNTIIINPEISSQLEGTYYLDLETTFDGVVKTIQRNTINFIPDITR